MASPRERRRGPVEVGTYEVLLGADTRSYVRTGGTGSDLADEAAELARASVVLCVDWAVRGCLSDHGWSPRQATGHLERVCRSTSATDYATRTGTSEVVVGAPPLGTLGPSVTVTLGRAEDGRFAVRWRVPEVCRTVSASARVLAALWSLADDAGHGPVVHHALFALRGGFERSGFFAPAVADDLVASLVNFGVEMAAADESAATSRAQLRIV